MCGQLSLWPRKDKLHSLPAPCPPLPLTFSAGPTASGPVTHLGYHQLTMAHTVVFYHRRQLSNWTLHFLCCETEGLLTPKKEKTYTGPCFSPLTPKEEADLGQCFLL